MQTIKFYINFGGFYYSVYSSLIDSIIESEIEEGYLKNDDDINYQSLYTEVAKYIFKATNEAFIDYINIDDLFTDAINFVELSSPKYYNYGTDVIIAEINQNNYNSIKETILKDTNFISYVNEASISYDGFTSFYEGIEEVKKEPSVFLQYLFDYVQSEYKEDINDVIFNDIHEVIYNAINETVTI